MTRRFPILVLAVFTALAAAAVAFAHSDETKLRGAVGPTFKISLTQDGHK